MHLAYNSINNKLYAFGYYGWGVVVDCATNRVVRDIPVPALNLPFYDHALWSQKNNKIYCAVGGMTVVDGAADTILATIPSDPIGCAFNDLENCLAAADWGGSLLIIDGVSNTIRARIATTRSPREVAWDARYNRYYVLEQDSAVGGVMVAVFDAASNLPIDSFPVPGTAARTLLYDSLSNKVYAGTASYLIAVDCATHLPLSTLQIPAKRLVWNSRADKLYCVGETTTTVVDCRTDSVIGLIPAGMSGEASVGCAFNPTDDKLYIGDSSNIKVVDGSSDTVLAVIPDTGYRRSTADIVWDEQDDCVYAARWYDHILVIDGRTNRLTNTIITGVVKISDIRPNPVVGKVYVADFVERDSTLCCINVLDGATGRTLKRFPVGLSAAPDYTNMCLDPTGTKLYCATGTDGQPGTVNVIDCIRDTIVKRIPVPECPVHVAVNSTDWKLYCTHDIQNGMLTIIDCRADTVISVLGLEGGYTLYATWHPGVDKVYVQHWESGQISVVDGVSNSFLTHINLDRGGTNFLSPVACDLRDNKVYATTSDLVAAQPGLYSIDAVGDTILDSFPQFTWGAAIAWNEHSDKVCFTGIIVQTGHNGIGVVDCATDSLDGVIDLRGFCSYIYAAAAGQSGLSRVYLAATEDEIGSFSGLLVLDCDRDTIIQSIEYPLPDQPYVMAFDSATNRVYTDGIVSRVFEFDVAPNGVKEAGGRLRSNSVMLECLPAVTRSGVTIHLSIAGGGVAQLAVFDRVGRRVRSFGSVKVRADMAVRWDGNDDQGRPVPTGVYMVRLRANQSSVCRKVVKLE